jgi:hypothetical protein
MKYKELVQGTYVGIKFCPDTIKKLVDLQKEVGVFHRIPPSKFHVTLVHSKKPVPWESSEIKETAKTKGFRIFKTRDSGTNCLVLELDSPYLHGRFAEAMALGATYDFDEYIPHITLSYNAGDIDIEALNHNSMDINLVEEYVESLSD